MSLDRDSFVFYRSFYEALRNVPKKHRTEVYDAVFAYAFEASEPSLNGVPRALWELIKPQLDASQKRYENAKKGAEYGKKGAEYGKLGGRPRKEKPPLRGKDENPLNVNVNENVNDNVNVNASGVPDDDTTTHIPLMADIKNEIAEKGYRLDSDSINRFIQYNREKGWKMNWKEALRKWAEKEQPNKSPAGKFANFPQRNDQEYRDLVNKVIKMNEGV